MMHKPCAELNISVLGLRQRQVQDSVECVLTNSNAHFSNISIGSSCFMHYINDVLSGKHNCNNLHNVFVARHEQQTITNELIEILNFKSFSDECNDFSLHHAASLSRITWNGTENLKENLCKILPRSMKRVGSSLKRTKINAFNLLSDS